MSPNPESHAPDLDGLKALAHPLRVQIIEALSTYGPHTASGLAARLGESSGATSYHLRQLEKHEYVREVADRGTGRERWWERRPGPIHLGGPGTDDSEAGKQASRLIMREWLHHREAAVRDVIERGTDVLSAEWADALALESASVHVTAEQLSAFNESINRLITEFATAHRGQRIPGSRPVQLQYFGFPVLDGDEVPPADPSDQSDPSAEEPRA
ncbi:ArsR/SmtB family transcription factor [Microcella flavibacter]|uniref:ArsR/SmtB family transcription factor n=1 Tax=Microcella flavibacter TaxID=1804990 RepID=UPI0014571F15|nr:winged helix-turn-helix domain-containing protein [Microcella flavibacter]